VIALRLRSGIVREKVFTNIARHVPAIPPARGSDRRLLATWIRPRPSDHLRALLLYSLSFPQGCAHGAAQLPPDPLATRFAVEWKVSPTSRATRYNVHNVPTVFGSHVRAGALSGFLGIGSVAVNAGHGSGHSDALQVFATTTLHIGVTAAASARCPYLRPDTSIRPLNARNVMSAGGLAALAAAF